MLRGHGGKGDYYHLVNGYNSRLDELQAAILRVKLGHLEEWIEKRRSNANLYRKAFAQFEALNSRPGALGLPEEQEYAKHVYYLYTVRLQNRDEVENTLRQQGIAAAVYYPLPLHLQEVYRGLGYEEGAFPISERCAREVLSLPMYPELAEGEIHEAVEAVASCGIKGRG